MSNSIHYKKETEQFHIRPLDQRGLSRDVSEIVWNKLKTGGMGNCKVENTISVLYQDEDITVL